MAPERLCLGCGLRVDEPFAPISTGERKKLFYAAQKLLTFVLHEVSAQTLSEEEAALQIALRPLITNKDGHFVAAVTSMYQSLLEGQTDCPISGVFGAGKTLSAAAMIAGLLVMDPSLTIMIVTKENVAAHAFVKHFLRLGLPESINFLKGQSFPEIGTGRVLRLSAGSSDTRQFMKSWYTWGLTLRSAKVNHHQM